MRLAERLGMTLTDCLNKVTYREYLTWVEYFFNELNNPDRHDYYMMQVAAEVHRGYLRDQRFPVDVDKFKITLIKKGEKQKVKHTPEQIEMKSKIARAMVEARINMSKRRNQNG